MSVKDYDESFPTEVQNQPDNRTGPSDSYKHLMSGNRLEAEGDDEQALAYFNKAIECRQNIEPIIRRGMYFYERNDAEQAISDFTFAINDAKPEEHRLAFAYAERGFVNIEMLLIPEGLDDLIRSFELLDNQLKAKQKVDEPEDSYIGQIEFFLEKCVPVIKLMGNKDDISGEEEEKLDVLKNLILIVRQEINY